MTDRVLVLGGPLWAATSLKALREVGIQVLLTDVDPECPCRRHSDYFFNISATDVEGILRAVRPLGSIAVAYCGNDFGATAAHRINEALQGRSLMDADPSVFVDKERMKSFFAASGIAAAAGRVVPLDNIESESFVYPVVAKPVAASGAVGVRFLADTAAAAAYALEFRGRFSEVLVEQALSGTQHDVNGCFVDGRFHPLGLADRFFAEYPLCYPTHGYAPSSLSDQHAQSCWDTLEAVGNAAGLVTGPLKSDVFVAPNSAVWTVEVGLRFHGDIMSSIVMPNTGRWFPLLEYVGRLLPGRFADIEAYLADRRRSASQVVRWDVIPPAPGIFVGLSGLERVETNPGVVGVFVSKKKGALLTDMCDNQALVGFFVTRGASYDECAEQAAFVMHNLKVQVEAPGTEDHRPVR